jgi:Uncharacterized protein conserved in bacteria (DUF2066)
MAPRLVTAVAGPRASRHLGWVLLLLVAMHIGPIAAEGADQAYSATVRVDGTADNAAAARDAARVDGQRRALAIVVGRLAGSAEPADLPKLDDKTVTDMVDSFEVANERMSAVHYIADYTFHFRPAKLRRLVRAAESAAAAAPASGDDAKSAATETASKATAESTAKTLGDSGGKATADVGGKAIVVLPVYKDGDSLVLWDDPNDWRTAWGQRAIGTAPTRVTLPLGDAGDLAAIDADKAASGEAEALTSIAKRNGASETVVALATARRQDGKLTGLEVSVKRYHSGRLIDAHASSFDADPGEGETDFLKRAVDAVGTDIESGANKIATAHSDQPTSLAVTVPITSLGEWVHLRERLASVASIRKIDLLSLSRQEAKIELRYVGTPEQLRSSLAEVNLELAGGGPAWRIQSSGVAGPH